MSTQELTNVLAEYGREHGLFQLQSELLRALLISTGEMKRVEFQGPGFKVIIRKAKGGDQ